jgi:hypothetical protein
MFRLLARAPALLGWGTPQEAVTRLRAELQQWTEGSLSDDVALLLAEQPDRQPGRDREPERAAQAARPS